MEQVEKECSECNGLKGLDKYYELREDPSCMESIGLSGRCRTCIDASEPRDGRFKNAYYHEQVLINNRRSAIKNRKKYQTKTQIEKLQRKLRLLSQFGKHCSQCGFDNPICLEFHHIDPQSKNASISSLLAATKNFDLAVQEAMKCKVLCANCHKKEHFYVKQK